MAMFKYSGVGELLLSMEQVAEIPDDVQKKMLNAAADIAVEKIRAKGEAYGVRRTGNTLRALIKRPAKRKKNGDLYIDISFNGKNYRGIRYAEIAFVNNYGTTKQKARPFFSDGMKDSEEEAGNAEEAVYNNWLDSKLK